MKIQDVIAAASEELQVSYGENALWFKVLIYQAVRTFKSSTALMTYTVEEQAEDHRLKLPDNLVRFEGIRESNGVDYCEGINYCVQDSYVIFESFIEIADGTRYYITYKGLPADSDGEVLLRDEWERLLVAYICWKYTRRHYDRYPAYIVQDFKKEFQLQKQAFV